ncbi:MAG: serine protein kinase PrkA [Deltaproteobacteria bacterium]|nr:serine protein kinase PrkA [Deltaproteobacteria bacterium]
MAPDDLNCPVPESSLVAERVASEGAIERGRLARQHVERIADEVRKSFEASKRVLSFGQYLEIFAAHPVRHGRPATHYVRDLFLHHGTEVVQRPWGKRVRYRLFDCPWEAPEERGREPTLVGHEELQGEVFRALCNFAREGRANRLILMHGPNGSAKSTAAACILRALEDYSRSEEGPLYRFHWIFPRREASRGAIGFGGSKPVDSLESFAHLDDADVDARLVIELRDHPLFLVPTRERRAMLDELWRAASAPGSPPEWLRTGELSHKNKQIFEALLASYGGDLHAVLRHVQVERFFISRRYRVGAVTLGPEMSVDARERQVTADRSVASLPTSLQATTLFDVFGELVEATGGVLEFSDLLKRPIDAFRYLQLTLETGQVALSQQTVFTNVVMLGSANDVHLAAFREHHEYPSFRGRIELVRAPYLRSYLDEERIYAEQVVPTLRRHVAPYTARVAAEFAVLTRMRKPDPARFAGPLAEVVKGLTALDKMILYAEGRPPRGLDDEKRKLLVANVDKLYDEGAADADYEGRIGVAPRTMRTLLFDAAQSSEYRVVSPFAVLRALEDLCRRPDEREWLERKPLEGGYHDPSMFLRDVRTRLFDRCESDLRECSGLIDSQQYEDLFRRYVRNVSAFVKREKVRNPLTGRDEFADAVLMGDVEQLLGSKIEPWAFRDSVIARIAAWAIEHPDSDPHQGALFAGYIERMRDAAFERLRPPFARLLRDLVVVLREGASSLDLAGTRATTAVLERLGERGYDNDSAADAASALLRERYADIVI